MIFNSFTFLTFFAVVLLLLWVTSFFTEKVVMRNVIVLVASYYFYGSFSVTFLLLLIYVTVLNYGIAFILDNPQYRYRKALVTVDVFLTLLPLLFYKYIEFLLTNIDAAFGTAVAGSLGKIALPVGISFFTFQTLSYTLDIYRQKIHAERNPLNVALFVAFFPTIMSGPIERARNMLPQIAENRKVTAEQVMSGLTIFVWGVFKKMVVADRLGEYVDWAYSTAQYNTGATLAIAAVLYSFQIYCDFSGYSDMAIGVARAMGFKVMNNFEYPYFAHSMKVFWRRWHISLTSWFTEYVYFSLGGSRVKTRWRWAFNISMVFLLSGIWHGAAWNFLLWGAIHALFYLTEWKIGLQDKNMENRWKYPRIILVFILTTFAWIFFRIENTNQAWMVVSKIVSHPVGTFSLGGGSSFGTAMSFFMLGILLITDWMLYRRHIDLNTESKAFSLKNLLFLSAMLLGISLFSVSSDSFVYFQF